MKEVISIFGKTYIAVFVVVLIGVILFTYSDNEGHVGILEVTGANAISNMREIDYSTYTDFSTYKSESEKTFPEVTYDASLSLETGQINLLHVIKAKNYSGNELPLHVTSIADPYGQELIEGYDETNGIHLSRAGIYTVTVWVVDDGARKTVCKIKIPING